MKNLLSQKHDLSYYVSVAKKYDRKSKTAKKRATKHLLNIIEFKARLILKQHPHLYNFVMGMGCVSFSTKDRDIILLSQRSYMKSLDNIIKKYDPMFYITGNKMRFTATGKKITNW
jgi:hypothetical protein